MLKKFIKDIALYSPSQLLPALTAFITTPILTRIFPPDEYGYWALAASVSAFLVALTVSGYGSAVIRYYPIYETTSKLRVFFASLILSAGAIVMVVTLISILIAPLILGLFPNELATLFPLIILIFIAQSLFTVFISVIRAKGRSGSFTSFQLFMSYGGLATGLLLVVAFGLRVNGLLWGTFVAMAFILPFLVHKATGGDGIKPRWFNGEDARLIWSYAWPLTLGNIAMWGLRVSDLFIISLTQPEREVGLYSVSYNISSRSVELLVSMFLLSVSPLIMNTWENQGKNITEQTMTMVSRIYLVMCMPAVVGLSVLAYPFIILLTSPDYYEGYKIVGFVALSSFIWGLANIAMMGLAIKKHSLRIGANQVVSAAIHIGLALVMVPKFGYRMAAVTTLIGYVFLFLLNSLGSRRLLTWRFPYRTLGNTIIASGVMGLAVWGIYGLAHTANSVSPIFLLISVCSAVIIYMASLWFLGEINEGEKSSLIKQLSRLKRRPDVNL